MREQKINKSLNLKDDLLDGLLDISIKDRRSLSWVVNDILRNSLGLEILAEGNPKKRSNRQLSVSLNVDVIEAISANACKRRMNSSECIIEILNREILKIKPE
jgi:hypothetical protein